jgi:hypothetical protein
LSSKSHKTLELLVFLKGFIRTGSDICGGVYNLAIKAFKISGGRPNQGISFKLGTTHLLVILVNYEFFEIFWKTFFTPTKSELKISFEYLKGKTIRQKDLKNS